MKGYERVLTSPLYSYMFTQSVSGIRMTYGHLGFYASHFTCLYHSTSLTGQRGYHGHSHGHDDHGDTCGYWTESDYNYGIDTWVDPYPLFQRMGTSWIFHLNLNMMANKCHMWMKNHPGHQDHYPATVCTEESY